MPSGSGAAGISGISSRRRLKYASLGAMLLIISAHCCADELSFFGGVVRERGTDESTAGWSLDYRHALTPNFGIAASWINQGHIANHHRDGLAAQLWATTTVLHPSLSVGAGVGPFFYFDTTRF